MLKLLVFVLLLYFIARAVLRLVAAMVQPPQPPLPPRPGAAPPPAWRPPAEPARPARHDDVEDARWQDL